MLQLPWRPQVVYKRLSMPMTDDQHACAMAMFVSQQLYRLFGTIFAGRPIPVDHHITSCSQRDSYENHTDQALNIVRMFLVATTIAEVTPDRDGLDLNKPTPATGIGEKPNDMCTADFYDNTCYFYAYLADCRLVVRVYLTSSGTIYMIELTEAERMRIRWRSLAVLVSSSAAIVHLDGFWQTYYDEGNLLTMKDPPAVARPVYRTQITRDAEYLEYDDKDFATLPSKKVDIHVSLGVITTENYAGFGAQTPVKPRPDKSAEVAAAAATLTPLSSDDAFQNLIDTRRCPVSPHSSLATAPLLSNMTIRNLMATPPRASNYSLDVGHLPPYEQFFIIETVTRWGEKDPLVARSPVDGTTTRHAYDQATANCLRRFRTIVIHSINAAADAERLHRDSGRKKRKTNAWLAPKPTILSCLADWRLKHHATLLGLIKRMQ